MNKTLYNGLKRQILALVFLSGIISCPCVVGQPTLEGDFGDAPEGYVAYPGVPPPGVIGWFPTCINVGAPGTYIKHGEFTGYDYSNCFGFLRDSEQDGNANSCALPPYTSSNGSNNDECFNDQDQDAGLIKPGAYTIYEFNGMGVVGTCPFSSGGVLGAPCATVTWGTEIDIRLKSGAGGYLNVLADWNQDGQWSTYTPCGATIAVDERVVKNVLVAPNFDGPISMLNIGGFQIGPNKGYVWFRFTYSPEMIPDTWNGEGSFSDGETEDYLLLVSGTDFGDAPSPYPTLLVNNGARHDIRVIHMSMDPDVWPDPESNGQPDANALGDDLNGIDDENGVLLPSFVPGQAVQCTVYVHGEFTGYPVSGKLTAWVDWDKNGQWENNPVETIINNQVVTEGANIFTINVPPGPTGYTYARFRISSQGVTSPYGHAPDGEVEDYRILVEIPEEYDFGDAPEGAPAYPPLGATGQFPTCLTAGPAGFVRTTIGNAFLGYSKDSEPDGNGGACPLFTPGLYNTDECQNEGDAGLSIAGAYTIFGEAGSEFISNCLYSSGEALGSVCTPAIWGQHLDLFVQNTTQSTVYVNALFDWDQDGSWSGSSQCPFGPNTPEHVLVNHPVPAGYSGMLSATPMIQPFFIGPLKGFFWARFTISEYTVNQNWDGSGILGIGEVEDYLLKVNMAQDLDLQNITIPMGQSYCFEAAQTITLAGGGTTVIVENGASANFVAGQSILMKEGTHFRNGSTVHAWIDLTGQYCTPMTTKSTLETGNEEVIPEKHGFFRVYPNPTPGLFTLEMTESASGGNIRVEIFSLMGERVLQSELPLMKQYQLDLSGRQPGLYLIKVMKGKEVGYFKLIRL